MQGTADFHDQVPDARLPEAAEVVDHAAALDAAVDVLNAHAPPRDAPIRGPLRAREGAAPRLPGRHDDLDLGQGTRQTAQVLEQPTPHWQGVRGRIGHAFIVGPTRLGLTQQEAREHGMNQQDVCDRVRRFLAAITARLLSRILGAFDAPFGPIVANRGRRASTTPPLWARPGPALRPRPR
jgi:hypothetical protein